MSSTSPSLSSSLDWHGPGAPARAGAGFDAKALVWALVFPVKRHRIAPTVPGIFLIVVALGIGSAAYNTANNILFITLSLLLACLLLSGLLSWFNFNGVCWRLLPQGPWRAGHEAMVTVEIQNHKRWLPTYSLWFELSTQPMQVAPDAKPAAEMKIREVLAAIERIVTRGKIQLRERVEPGGEARLEWLTQPRQRGENRVMLDAVGSLFPFGFLKKSLGVALKEMVLVWPAQVSYQWTGTALANTGSQGQRTVRAGRGDDLLALRNYAAGDSHRLIHWKASARLGHLMVRQFAAESHDGYALRLDTPAGLWTRPEQFELLCSFAATMAEDLFAGGRLRGISLNGGPLLETRGLRDLEALLDELAKLQVVDGVLVRGAEFSRREVPLFAGGKPGIGPGTLLLAAASSGSVTRPASRLKSPGKGTSPTRKMIKNIITFAPEGARGVAAYVDGRQTASA